MLLLSLGHESYLNPGLQSVRNFLSFFNSLFFLRTRELWVDHAFSAYASWFYGSLLSGENLGEIIETFKSRLIQLNFFQADV